ncbi:HlyD family type I secretion periplasmic adaptor subunit [Rhizobium rhizophilum]|uniref:Membrane fusion protein (MFP) family protein n=1 Tax=Rhizobium rhizophilum TaxID=1850373 RepID=A0ABY2QS49_9HYPH|nr:HlyD family type I secretion periplasmic adaptor subunit [Rhizobium rhizophilum]THV12707.1 HlyD family type I secretion periplasmic adaptor subunit [Rhizobium rhizophilum]
MTDRQSMTPIARSIRNYSLLAFVTILILVMGFGGWAATVKLSGAVIGHGVVVVDGNVKKIQHRTGGIVGEILVRNGARVAVGDLLIRMDDTITRANLAIVTKQVDQLSGRRLRLVAERDGLAAMALSDMSETEDGGSYVRAEEALFTARRETLQSQQSQLRQRIDQIGQETDGLTVRLKAKEQELSWVEQELVRVRSLSGQQLIQFNRLAELERLKAQLDGERGQLIAEIARAGTRVTETELQILQLDQDRRTEIVTELRDVDNKLAELEEQQVTAEDELKRVDIRSPQDGIVHELAVHTIGGVVAPGETVMQIVPSNDSLVVEARILPADIDQVHPGQKAVLRFSAFNQRTTPEVFAKVETVAADLVTNPQTGEAWYSIRIRIPAEEMAKLGNLTLLSGMPVEVFVKTGERTAMSYLLKPLSDQLARAMTED